jgi:VanZ family protein
MGLAVLIVVAYGGTDEYHQAFVDGRTSELADVVADATGGVLAVVAARVWVILSTNDAMRP